MARGQHTNVIEPPNRTAHNLAYAAEWLVQVLVNMTIGGLLFAVRSWPLVPFMITVTVGLTIAAHMPLIIGGRIVEYAAKRQRKNP